MSAIKIRKYAATAWMEAGGHVNDSALFIVDYIMRFARVAVMLGIWRIVMEGRGTVNGLDLADVLTYALIAEVFAELFTARTWIEHMVWEGKIATLLLRPMGIISMLVSQSAGRWLIGFGLCSIPLILAAPLLGVNPLPASESHGLLFLISLLLAVSVALAVDFIFCSIVVAMNSSIWITESFRAAVTVLFSGAAIPLALLPWGIGSFFEWLPFASMASAPLRIYTGAVDSLKLLALQAAWAALLWPLARRMWDSNRERLSSYGG
jgi:ABC-type uncharacterized transport system permease subunit